MPGGGNVTERLDQIGKAIEALKNQVPSTDWLQANTVRIVGELAEVLRDVAAGDCAQVEALPGRVAKDRKSELDKLLWMAVKALPPGTGPDQRDELIRHVLASWHVSDRELATLGYGKA
jgi:hypothetical protein